MTIPSTTSQPQPPSSNKKNRLRSKLIAALAVLLLIVGSAAAAMGQGATSDPDVDVTIGFQGLKINAASSFNVSLNGATINGSAADCGAFPETNKALTTLKIDQTYDLIPSSGICYIHIHFDVPECYTLEADGKETTDLLWEPYYQGGLVHKLVVRKKCSDKRNAAGHSAGPQLSSIVWEVGMGALSDGRSAENISLRERVMTAALYSPTALIYAPPINTDEVDVVRNPSDGSLRQVKAKETLADVVVVDSSEYDVRFYTIANVGAKDVDTGIYALSGQPFVVWKIKNPNPATSDHLQILRIEGVVTDTSEYIWDSATSTWSLSRGDGAAMMTSIDVIDGVTGDRTRTSIIKDSVGTVVSKTAETYHTFPWGETLIKTVVDPDGAALTTLYTYFENAAETNRYGKPESLVNPDGSWEKYDYDFLGNKTVVMRPWKDQDMASATETNCHLTRYGYIYYRTDYYNEHQLDTYLTSIEESIAGVVVGQTTIQRMYNLVNGIYAVTETTIAHSSALDGSIASTTTYDDSLQGANAWLRNRTVYTVYPDGRQDTFTYEKGDYVTNADPSLNQFTPNPNGVAERTTVVHSVSSAPDGVVNRSTKDASVIDGFGRAVLREQYVYGSSGYERIGWAAMDYDARGHIIQTRQHDGRFFTATWVDNYKISDIDAEGMETTYTYDSLQRVKTRTKKGAPVSGSYPAQSDIVTTYNYDPEGRVTSETIAGGGLTLVQSTAYDIAGRIINKTEQTGLSTTFGYTNGGRTATVTLPGGATQITDKFIDGTSKSVTGTSVVPRYFDYGVNAADGTKYTQEFIGSAGLSSPRWTKSTVDWAGHNILIEKPGISGTVAQTYGYNDRGQLVSEAVVSGTTRMLADKLYEYDNFGEPTRVGLDVDGSGSLTTSSTDRVADNSIVYEKIGSSWFSTSTSKTYLTNNNATATTTEITRQRLTNFPVNGSEQTQSELATIDVAGNQTTVTVAVDRGAKKVTTRTDVPESTTDSVNIGYNGLLQSSTPETPQSATNYAYDSLGRMIGKTSPATGTSTTVYETGTGRVLSNSQAANTITNEYYPSTHASAGRLKSVTNVSGKKVYFNYNLRGDLVQTWGDSAYPLEYVFDSYGQKTEQHTFRGGSGWSASAWPSATTGTADLTKWIYHDPSGLLTQREDAAAKQMAYNYDAFGRLRTRTLARGAITTTYSYDVKTGEMAAVDYSDSTPDVTFVYDRGGRRINVTDAGGTHTITYGTAGNLLTDQVSSGLLDDLKVTVGYDSFLRRSSLQTTRNTTTLGSQTYGYDVTSRLATITSGAQTATYAYFPITGMLNSVTFTGGTNIVRGFDTFGRLSSIANNPAGGGATSYVYTYNNLNQRTRVTREDNSYWSYVYNDRGELTSGKKYWSDATLVSGQQTVYDYDNIGNRNTASNGGDAAGANLRQSTYSGSALNQYSQRTNPGAVDIIGTASSGATVTVNGQATYRKGTYFHKALALDNSAAPIYSQVDVSGVKINAGSNGEDAVTQQGGQVYLAKATELYTYDFDGNMTSDGRWNYAWDAENRLTSMTAIASAPVAAKRRLEFVYDYIGRRIQKKYYVWNSTTSAYQLQTMARYLYDGWDLEAELDGSNAAIRTYVRSSGGSGDASGLLMINDSGSTYFAGYDGNNNIVNLIKASDGTVQASYEYNGFGETITTSGAYAPRNPIRFSAAYADQETGLLYYGYRYYNPGTGRWINRDPVGEDGGVNLYGFVENDGINSGDYLGLWKRDEWTGGWFRYSGHAIAEKCDRLSELARLITGDENDWKFLGKSGTVREGESVDITPLLKRLETKLRDGTASSSRQFNPVGFPNSYDAQGIPNATPWLISGGSQAGEINKFFNRATPYGRVGCDDAANIILSKALIDVIGGEMYDQVLARLGNDVLGILLGRQGKISSMLVGDRAWIPNYSDYEGLPNAGDYGHENSIKIARNQYFGHPLGRFSKQRLERLLQDAYTDAGGAKRRDRIPGLRDEIDIDITFVDVAKTFGAVFDIRNEKRR